MFNLGNIDLSKQYGSTGEEVKALKGYVYQLVNEIEFRLNSIESSVGAEAQAEKYPVGSVYQTVKAVEPAALFGGQWKLLKEEQIEEDTIYTWKRAE